MADDSEAGEPIDTARLCDAPQITARVLGKTFAPCYYTYAVIRMDPRAMVEGLDDPQACEEVESLLAPKKYLVFLDTIIGIPWPDRPPYEYLISPIAPCLRKEDPEMCFTRDMAMPIYPNTSHPHQREPIHTDPQFPFSNCYHWLDYHMRVHVRARAEMFDHSKAIMLPHTSYVALDRVFSEDRRRCREERNPPTLLPGASDSVSLCSNR
ncbi:hypothetical protein K466DRAFT_491187 [Polyporus arcularius HHB13444]|uniref:Uncharacterized protein n=1 Tax=Polyporus arcularius HHB13444 TaxID=1314778 RepID=A0A5C3PMM4_9APHY|nr:hypothetical protein K466DRAFT_491187 [Polyporus arcularius HHB13444]